MEQSIIKVTLFLDGTFDKPVSYRMAAAENNVTKIQVRLPKTLLVGMDHYIEIKGPRNESISTESLPSTLDVDGFPIIEFPVVSSIFGVKGKYLLGYTGRGPNEQIWKSKNNFEIVVGDAINASDYYEYQRIDIISAILAELAVRGKVKAVNNHEPDADGKVVISMKDIENNAGLAYSSEVANLKKSFEKSLDETNKSLAQSITTGDTSTLNAAKTYINQKLQDLLGEGVPEAYDTLKELYDYIKTTDDAGEALKLLVQSHLTASEESHQQLQEEITTGDNSTLNAAKTYINQKLQDLLGEGVPEAYDTLKELYDYIKTTDDAGEALKLLVQSHLTASEESHQQLQEEITTGDNSTLNAAKTYINQKLQDLLGEGVPEAYDTLKELYDYIKNTDDAGEALKLLVQSHLTASEESHQQLQEEITTGDNSTLNAAKTYINQKLQDLLGEGVPEAYDTLKELYDYIKNTDDAGEALKLLVQSHLTASEESHQQIEIDLKKYIDAEINAAKTNLTDEDLNTLFEGVYE